MYGPLNLDYIPHDLHQQVIESYEDGNAIGMLTPASSDFGLEVVWNNVWPLKDRGIYEEALLFAYTSPRVNNHNWPIGYLRALLEVFADREALLAAGDPLPDGDTFEIYRGVGGVGRRRRCRGYSWTLDLDQACWFAHRSGDFFCFGNPGVVRATVQRDDVLAYDNGREEQEVIVRPPRCRRMRLTSDELRRRADAEIARRRTPS